MHLAKNEVGCWKWAGRFVVSIHYECKLGRMILRWALFKSKKLGLQEAAFEQCESRSIFEV